MPTILLIDEDRGRKGALASALCEAGFDVKTVSDPQDAPASLDGVDVTVLVAAQTDLAILLGRTRDLREEGTPPMVLVTALDRSGWDRTFSSAEAFEVDALLDLPLDSAALITRLKGIIAAQADVTMHQVRTPEIEAIVARAVTNEEAAEAFYRRAAEVAENSETRKTLLSLASDEAQHKQLLLDFKSGKRPLPEQGTDATTLVESFGAPDLTPDLAPADAFLLAARKEKLAVEFYENWAALYPPGAERETLMRLAEVEREHKTRVEEMFSRAAFPESF